jgi:hypothetical protein
MANLSQSLDQINTFKFIRNNRPGITFKRFERFFFGGYDGIIVFFSSSLVAKLYHNVF